MRLIDADALIAYCGEKWIPLNVDAVNAQPTITPKHNDGWVLCSERMPPEHEWIGTRKFGTTMSDEVYVTFEEPEGERFTKHLQFQNGELSRYDKAFMDAWCNGAKPIAWTPLPEPFKGEK